MNINEKIREHELWLETKGYRGEKAVFRDVDLTNVDFSNRDLREVEFHDCTATAADFKNANMENCIIKRCFMPCSNFGGTVLRNSQLLMSIFYDSVFDRADMSFSNIALSRFNRVSFRYTHLIRAKAHGAVFSVAVFDRADMRKAVMFGADLENSKVNAKIAGTDFTGAYLHYADFSEATGNANFKKAKGLLSAGL